MAASAAWPLARIPSKGAMALDWAEMGWASTAGCDPHPYPHPERRLVSDRSQHDQGRGRSPVRTLVCRWSEA